MTAYRDPTVRFIKLADGGLTDNFAVSTLVMSRLAYGTPYAPLTQRDAVRIRRLLLIVVDASQGPTATGLTAKPGRAASTWRSPRPTLRSTRPRGMPWTPSAA